MTLITTNERFISWWGGRTRQNETKELERRAFIAGHSDGWRDGYEAALKVVASSNEQTDAYSVEEGRLNENG